MSTHVFTQLKKEKRTRISVRVRNEPERNLPASLERFSHDYLSLLWSQGPFRARFSEI